MRWFTIGTLSLWLVAPPGAAAQPADTFADFAVLLDQLESLAGAGDRTGFLSLLAPDASEEAARAFATVGLPDGVSRAVVEGRFLLPLPDVLEGTGYRFTVEVFTESGDRGRLQTWDLDLTRGEAAGGSPGPWQIADQLSVHALEGLRHLTLNGEKQFDATDLVITGEDMTLRMSRGAAFVSEIDSGVTGVVLVGAGVLTFSPAPEAERRQLEIFSGREILEAEFTHAFVRLHPDAFTSFVSTATLVEAALDADLEEARETFDELAGQSFTVDLSHFSDRSWWFTPMVGDLLAEVRTRRHGTLTYRQAQNQPEDISLNERDPRRIISLYQSARKRAVQGRYYGDPDTVSYDVLDYDIQASFEPRGVAQESLDTHPRLRGCWIEGTTRLAVRAMRRGFTSLTLRLADDLQIRSIVSRELGPLPFYRMTGQSNVIINLPTEVPIDTSFTVAIRYAGLLEADTLEENWIGHRTFLDSNQPLFEGKTPERRYLYTNASYWYPQATVPDFATATMNLTVPADYGVLASGDPDDGNPLVDAPKGVGGTRSFVFSTFQPTRYLSCFITRFASDDTPSQEVVLTHGARESEVGRRGVSYDSLSVSVRANDFSRRRIAEFRDASVAILSFYASLVGDLPYPTFTLALSDSRFPGGHSPAYFAVLNQPLPMFGNLMMTWQTDPVSFSGYPSFFLAHELAHQWWGQAVGWKNYHERWLSEGLSQYFAALYAQKEKGDETFADVLSQLRRWSIRHSDEGPVYLGYRLGQIDGEPRVFRALVYNKAALVLHMLRRLIGDQAFFAGLRRFYNEMRFQIAGTDDLIRAFETEANRSLKDFFERWIFEFDVPSLRFDYRTEARLSGQQGESDVVLRFEQEGQLFEVPVTVTLRYRSGLEKTVIVPVTDQITEVRVPLAGRLRDVEVNKDHAALAEIRQ